MPVDIVEAPPVHEPVTLWIHRVLSACGRPDYQKQLAKELGAIGNSEMWTAGKAVRQLRPKEPARAIAKGTKGVGGRTAN